MKAMKGWGTDQKTLVRMLAGFDGAAMGEVTKAFERKYDIPLYSSLRKEISGHFLKVWKRAQA